jgi:hypothetical protein
MWSESKNTTRLPIVGPIMGYFWADLISDFVMILGADFELIWG